MTGPAKGVPVRNSMLIASLATLVAASGFLYLRREAGAKGLEPGR